MRFTRWGVTLLGRTMRWFALFLIGIMRANWWGLRRRGRVALSLAILVVIAATTSTFSPMLSAAVQGLAVLLIAVAGLWLILTGPFRPSRRRW